MKKLIISILVILLIVLTGMTVVKGLKIGNINILGISELKKENDELDTKVKEATKLASTDYQKKIDELNKQLKELQSKKEEYLDLELELSTLCMCTSDITIIRARLVSG